MFGYSFAGYEWVGWRNDTLGMSGKPVELTFEFDSVRNFSAIVLHTNNMFSKDVQVSFIRQSSENFCILYYVMYSVFACYSGDNFINNHFYHFLSGKT